jgi:arylformamidase
MVYKKYNQEELDKQYNNRIQVPDFEKHLQLWETASAYTAGRRKYYKDISYGNRPEQLLDIYPSGKKHSKTLVFIHGGYWHSFNKSSFHFIADAFKQDAITTVLITYPLMPMVGMETLLASVALATRWLIKHIEEYNGNPDALYLCGHSAGAHLSALLLCNNRVANDIGGFSRGYQAACLISGIYNLIPIELSYLNKVLGLTRAVSLAYSPCLLKPSDPVPIWLVTGAEETEEYKDQAAGLATAWGPIVQTLEIPGTNHFSLLETILEESGTLQLMLQQMMQLA